MSEEHRPTESPWRQPGYKDTSRYVRNADGSLGKTLVGLASPSAVQDALPTDDIPTVEEKPVVDVDAHPFWGSASDPQSPGRTTNFDLKLPEFTLNTSGHQRNDGRESSERRHPGRRKDDQVALFSARLRRTSGSPTFLLGGGLVACGGLALIVAIALALNAIL